MKIGILTVFDAVNYGSFLQAFCLQEYLKRKGHEVIMIKKNSIIYEKWRFTSLFTYNPQKMRFKLQLARGYFKSWKVFNIEKNPKALDVLLVGSDEMWELNNITFKSIPEYFGNNINAKKKITYAVSSNSTKKEDILKYPFIQEGLKSFSSVAVRDKSTYDAYAPYVRVTPQYTADPTLIMDLRNYLVETKLNNYILCYTYTFKDYMIEAVKKLANITGKKVVVAGQNYGWADLCIPATPFEFLGLIKGADFIVTDTFHGTTLSIALKKEFVSFAYKEKVYRALELFNLLNRDANMHNDLLDFYNSKINYSDTYEYYIKPLQNKSLDYLESAIGE